MATNTAFMLIGQNHPNDGGIVNLSHQLLLSENGVARWSLYALEDDLKKVVSVIPTPEHMLEDGLLIVGLFALKEAELSQLADELFPGWEANPNQFFARQSRDRLSSLYELCRKLRLDCKVALTVFAGSSVGGQLKVLEQYRFEVEVCSSIYHKFWSMWTNSWGQEGHLE